MSFKNTFEKYDWDTLEKEIYAYTAQDVRRVLDKSKIDLIKCFRANFTFVTWFQ